jgi:hypothetical protein
MTSPSLLSQPVPKSRQKTNVLRRVGLPVLLFCVTLLSTTSIGMRYMYNFRLANPPLASDADILPFEWVLHHLASLRDGLPFSLTLISILLVHEFGHFFACRAYSVRATLPYMLPAPSLSGTFGAVIRIRSRIHSRAALMAIGAAGPLAGFVVALASVTLGLALSTYAAAPLVTNVQPPLLILLLHRLLFASAGPLPNIVPHPVLIASWIGLLITALNLIPAGQLDGGHILYALSPAAHRWSSRLVIAALLALGFFCWTGWFVWAIVLSVPGMRHPRVPDPLPLPRVFLAVGPACLLLLLLCGTPSPFTGYSLLHVVETIRHHRF